RQVSCKVDYICSAIAAEAKLRRDGFGQHADGIKAAGLARISRQQRPEAHPEIAALASRDVDEALRLAEDGPLRAVCVYQRDRENAAVVRVGDPAAGHIIASAH